MQEYTYKTHGTCSRQIIINTEDDKVQNVTFIGGCSGNTQGVSQLVRGMKIDEVIEKLRGIDCGGKGTSCPDQLAQALTLIKNKH